MWKPVYVWLDENIAVLLKTNTSRSQWSQIPERVTGCSFAGSGKALGSGKEQKRLNALNDPQ